MPHWASLALWAYVFIRKTANDEEREEREEREREREREEVKSLCA